MIVRFIFGLGWALVTGLAGGWLILAPWALGEQGGGDWTTVTRNQVFTGLALIALAVLAAVVVVGQTVRSLREAGVIEPAKPARRPRTEAGGSSSPEMEKAWNELSRHPLVYGSVDLFRCGILFFEPALNKQHFVWAF